MTKLEYLLVCLMEECAEVTHRAAKVSRFGLDDINPDSGISAPRELNNELTDLLAVADLVTSEIFAIGRVTAEEFPSIYSAPRWQAKKDKVAKFMDYSREHGVDIT